MEKCLGLLENNILSNDIEDDQNYLCAAIFVLVSFPDPHRQPQVRVHKFLSRMILQPPYEILCLCNGSGGIHSS